MSLQHQCLWLKLQLHQAPIMAYYNEMERSDQQPFCFKTHIQKCIFTFFVAMLFQNDF